VKRRRHNRSLQARPAAVILVFVWLMLTSSDTAANAAVVRGLRFAVLAVLVANLVLAWITVRGISVRVVSQPRLAYLGDPAEIEIELTGRSAPVAVRMRSSHDAPWVSAAGNCSGWLPGVADFRGVAREVTVQVRSDGPLGLVGYSRSFTIPIRPLWIAPRPTPPRVHVDLEPTHGAERTDDGGAHDAGDTPSMVREYQAGDSLRRISWPVTARIGTLMSRTFDDPTGGEVVLAVDLGRDPRDVARADGTAATAAWLGHEVLDRGWRLRLVFVGPDGPVEREVDRMGLHCGLAEAVCGPPVLPEGGPVLVVTPEAVAWR
jgi:uncharacterized protein (DUF58 family)